MHGIDNGYLESVNFSDKQPSNMKPHTYSKIEYTMYLIHSDGYEKTATI